MGIPTLSVSPEDGQALRDELAMGPVSVTLHRSQGVQVDGALDNTLVAHEWGHYLFGRLADCSGKLCRALNEGWADFTALHMVLAEGDDLDGTYALGTYATTGTSEDPAYYGLRRVPYSRDPARNALSFRHIANGVALPDTHPMAESASMNAEAHNAGEVWAFALFDAYLALQERGASEGAAFDEVGLRMADLMVAGLVLAPEGTDLLELRDALLSVAEAGDPDDALAMAAAFAGLGMGTCAAGPDPSSANLAGVVEDFALHPVVALSEPTLSDSLVSCDDDGLLDGGEAGEVRLTVTNTGGADLAGATLTVTLDPEPTGLRFPQGRTVAVPTLAPFDAEEVSLAVVLDRHEALRDGATLTVVADAEGACIATVTAAAWARVEADLAPGAGADDDFGADDGSWSVAGDGDDEIWSRLLDEAGDATWLGVDPSGVTDAALVSPVMRASADEELVVTLEHRYAFEASDGTWWDGRVIELQADGGEWVDLSTLVDPGYDRDPVRAGRQPLSGRAAFSGANAGWPDFDTVALELGSSLAGSSFALRFRVGTDRHLGDYGWEIAGIAVDGLDGNPFPAWTDDATECNPPPVARAGEDQVVTSGSRTRLDGSGSADPTGEDLVYSWRIVAGEGAMLENAGSASPTLLAPEVATIARVEVELEVSDGDLSDTDRVAITVTPEGRGVAGDDKAAPALAAGSQPRAGCGCAGVGRSSREALLPEAAMLITLLRRRRPRPAVLAGRQDRRVG